MKHRTKKILVATLSIALFFPTYTAEAKSKTCSKVSVGTIDKNKICKKTSKGYRWTKIKYSKDSSVVLPETVVVETKKEEAKQETSTTTIKEETETVVATAPSEPKISDQEKLFNKIRSMPVSKSLKNFDVSIFESPNMNAELLNLYKNQFDYTLRYFDAQLKKITKVHGYFLTHDNLQILKDNSQKYYDAMWIYDNTYRNSMVYSGPNGSRWSGSGTGSMIYSKNGEMILVLVVVSHSSHTINDIVIELVPHETTHLYQIASTPNVRKQNFIGVYPNITEGTIYMHCNMVEGGANSFGMAIGARDFSEYSHIVKRTNQRIKQFMQSSNMDVVAMLKQSESWLPGKCDPGAAVGAYLYDWVMLEYGVESYFSLLNNIAILGNQNDAIYKVFGFSKDDLYKKAETYILDMWNR